MLLSPSALFLCCLAFTGCCSAQFSPGIGGPSSDVKRYGEINSAGKIAVSVLETRRLPSCGHTVLFDSNSTAYLVEVKELPVSTFSVICCLKTDLIGIPPHVAISTVLVAADVLMQTQGLSALRSIHSGMRSFGQGQKVKVAPVLSLPFLETYHSKKMHGMIDLFRRTKSFVVVELPLDEDLTSKSCTLETVLQRVVASCITLHDIGMPVILKVRISVSPGGAEINWIVERLIKWLENHTCLSNIICGLYVEVSSSEEVANTSTEVQLQPPSHRILLDHKVEPIRSNNMAIHDIFAPITNPTTTPVTVPYTTPAAGIVTIQPSTPVTVLPVNPAIPTVTVPTNPVTTPITIPATNPTIPITVPSNIPPPSTTPVTNPVTTPVTIPPPVNNPITNYPFPPPSGIPGGTTPGTVPVLPPSPGQTWCIAKTGVSDAALQLALDYACGIGGVDCSAIQPTGSCYNPNTLRDHASYAFNSYYQKNPTPTSCDFGGTAMLVNTNPSTPTCAYPASSLSTSVPNQSPLSNSLPSQSSPGSSTTIFGSNNPFGTTNPVGSGIPAVSNNPVGSQSPSTTTASNALSLSAGLSLCLLSVTTLFISNIT